MLNPLLLLLLVRTAHALYELSYSNTQNISLNSTVNIGRRKVSFSYDSRRLACANVYSFAQYYLVNPQTGKYE